MNAGTRNRGPLLALAGIVVLAFAVYAVLASFVSVPRVHPDEVRYMIGASSLVEGDGLSLRGDEYGFGPLHAAVLALILWLSPDLEGAYPWFKVVNALFWALTAIPVYLLARRLVSAWWAVLAAGLAVAIPSSISVATVMTESMSYLAAAWALYATMLALERPTMLRQLALLAAIAVAFLTRSQLGILYVGWLAALGTHWWISAPARPRGRADLMRFWPSFLPLAAAVVGLGARLATGSSPRDSLGAYWELWRGYDLFGVAKWFVYHLADIELYLAVVPLAVAPIVLVRLVRSGRAGSIVDSAFASLFLAANAAGLLVVAAFTSTPWGYDRLHDRYAFYLLPLWLIGFVVWLAAGLPRPLVATATGVALALALPAVLPFRQLANEAGIDTVPGALWVWVESQVAGPGPLSGSRLLAVFVVALLLAVVLVPRRAALALAGAMLMVFAVTSVLAWERLIDAPEDRVFAGGLERSWIDDEVDAGARVTKLYVETVACPASATTRHALFLSEAFNATVDRAAYLGESVPDGLPIERVDVGAGGTLETSPGNPLVAEYVYTQPGLDLDGDRVATGTTAKLVLWRTDGPVRVTNATSSNDVRTLDCA
ncbi:MAG TPA: glycosyltransferase family 39 protein [Gaiellaceae bacterium]|nr:glycosyltransferase family 39 protein [Gaiellaceae bacterium]